MGFKEAMASVGKENWQASVDQVHERMLKNGVGIIDSTWAMRKVNGEYCDKPKENPSIIMTFVSSHA